MKIEVGRSYLTRSGRIATIDRILSCNRYPVIGFLDRTRQAWTLNGESDVGSPGNALDLVAEYGGKNAFEAPKLFPDPETNLRDWFAGMALQGMLAYPGYIAYQSSKTPEILAEESYKCADAMLEKREKKK